MKFTEPLITGTLIKRYKRFLADIKLEDGTIITAHTANTGSMKGLITPGNKVYLSYHDNPKRKLKYSWEIVNVGDSLVGINTSLPNKLVVEAIQNKLIPSLNNYQTLRTEVKYGENSRIDILLQDPQKEDCYIEVKNITLLEGNIAMFPDSVSLRGQKHLKELMNVVKSGKRACMFYVIQRTDAKAFAPADHIDPEYGKLLRKAIETGVEVFVYQTSISEHGITIKKQVNLKIQ